MNALICKLIYGVSVLSVLIDFIVFDLTSLRRKIKLKIVISFAISLAQPLFKCIMIIFLYVKNVKVVFVSPNI